MPLLRERRLDIPELVQHFLTTRRVGPLPSTIALEALESLKRYDWPGNVRELANVLERAQILAENHVITPDDLPESILSAAPSVAVPTGDPRSLSAMEQSHIEMVLREEKGNKVQAAKVLGISRRALYRLIEKYGLGGSG